MREYKLISSSRISDFNEQLNKAIQEGFYVYEPGDNSLKVSDLGNYLFYSILLYKN